MATALLATLKLTAAVKPQKVSITQFRRNKLVARIQEQIQLATAQQQGQDFVVKQMRSSKDAVTGLRQTVEATKRVKPWWFVTDAGKLAVSVRYGAKVLSLNSKGLASVEVENTAALVPTLEVLKAAVEAGELDAAMEAASSKMRQAFKR